MGSDLNAAAVRFVRGFAVVEGFTGRFGSGKTYSMVRNAWAKRNCGLRLASNFELKGDGWGDWIFLDNVYDLVALQGCLVLIDEASIWFDNRDWSDKGMKQVMNWILQSRHHGCHLWWASQSEKSVDTKLVRTTATFWTHEKWLWNWFRQRGYEPSSGERFQSHWYRFDPAMGARYDTGEIIGLKDGSGRSQGYINRMEHSTEATEDARLVASIQGALRRETPKYPGAALYRPAVLDDALGGADLFRFKG